MPFVASLPPETPLSTKSDLRAYRQHPREVERVSRLFTLLSRSAPTALDVGARDGHLSLLLAERFERVVSLDLRLPQIDHPRIECVQGNAAELGFDDRAFHTVVCAEVLEHIPPALLPRVCSELARVTDRHLVIGVPFRQDLRVGCTTCGHCGGVNPPYGHVNSFDLPRLAALMPGLQPAKVDYVGRTRSATNAVSAGLLRFAGNPFGTYDQEEPCVHCDHKLRPPAKRSVAQRVATRLAYWGNGLQAPLTPWRANWIHVRFERAS